MIKKTLIRLLQKTFTKAKIPKNNENLMPGDFDDWDSLGHLKFLLSIEKHYEIKFTMVEIMELKKISQIVEAIKNRNLT